jgi:hypothetical protein
MDVTTRAAIQVESWSKSSLGSGDAAGDRSYFLKGILSPAEVLDFLDSQAGKLTSGSWISPARTRVGLGLQH